MPSLGCMSTQKVCGDGKMLHRPHPISVLLLLLPNTLFCFLKGGRRSEWVRNWAVWRYFRDYFPIQVKAGGCCLRGRDGGREGEWDRSFTQPSTWSCVPSSTIVHSSCNYSSVTTVLGSYIFGPNSATRDNEKDQYL